MDVGVMKPIATGGRVIAHGRMRHLVSDDAIRLARAAGSHDPWDLVNPICLKEPLAPWTAAMRAHRVISLTTVMQAARALLRRHEIVIVEGIGGLLVPLTARLTVADLARRMGFPLLLVARARLGTLNHTLLSLQCAQAKGLRTVGVILNHAEPPGRERMSQVAQRSNPRILRRLVPTPVAGPLPFRPHLAHSRLAQWLESSVGRPWMARLITALSS